MRLLFLIDPPQALNPKKDSTIALMRAAQARGDEVYYAQLRDILLADNTVHFNAARLALSSDDSAAWFSEQGSALQPATFFNAILVRKEPPVDEAFVMATRLLDKVDRRVPVVNAPRALREENEKLAILNFPALIAPTWVGADYAAAVAARRRFGRAVLKPLNGMGGQGVYISAPDDKNFHSIFDVLSDGGKNAIMLQAYLPAAREGDFRVFVAGGRGLPHMLARIPRADDHRGNMAAGGRPEARRPDAAAQKIVAEVAPLISKKGIVFAGLDIIGGKLIEINITCPTGLREVADQTGDNIAQTVLEKMTSPQH